MPLLLRLDRHHAKAWLNRLLVDLRHDGHVVGVKLHDGGGSAPACPTWLLALEAKLYGVNAQAWRAPFDAEAGLAGGDIEIALSPDAGPDSDFILRVEDGDLASLPMRLAQGQSPRLVLTHRDGRTWMARPASEKPFSVAATLDAYIQRLGMLITKAVNGHPEVRLPKLADTRSGQVARRAFGHFLEKLLGLMAPARFRADHWNVGVRRRLADNGLPGPDLTAGCHWLADGGHGYLADPILWEADGKAYLFVEMFPFESMTGYLAVAELDDAGMPISGFRQVLMRPGHLSYPFLFTHEGETYLLPENAAEGHLPLYRAGAFPDQWEECTPLLPVGLQDATLFPHDGRFWLLGNENRNGSSWDCLCAYHAPTPLGPFEPHQANPLIIDAATARSAGPVLETPDGPVRPIQDCLGGYGRGVNFARIVELTPRTYRQELLPLRLSPSPGSGMDGLHTYSRSARFEAIDGLTTRQGRLAR